MNQRNVLHGFPDGDWTFDRSAGTAPHLVRPPCSFRLRWLCAALGLALVPACGTTSAHAARSEPSGSASWAPKPQASEEQPGGMFTFRVAGGDSEVESPGGAPLETDAFWVGLGFEGVGRLVGGGVQVGVYFSDDDQFENSPLVDTTVVGLTVFPHLTIRPAGGPFRIPIRIGPEVLTHSLDTTGTTAGEIDYLSIGGALEVEPEIDFVRRDNFAFSAFGKLRGGVAATYISTDPGDYTSDATMFGAEIGLRLQAAKFLVDFGYMNRQTSYDVGDPDDVFFGTPAVIPEIDFTFDGVFLDLGVRW